MAGKLARKRPEEPHLWALRCTREPRKKSVPELVPDTRELVPDTRELAPDTRELAPDRRELEARKQGLPLGRTAATGKRGFQGMREPLG